MTLKVNMQHWVLEYYQVCSNDEPRLTFTHFTARSNLDPYAFVWEEGKTMDFSETIAVCYTEVGRCSQLNEYMNRYEYQGPMSFTYLIDHGPRSRRFNVNFFSLETAGLSLHWVHSHFAVFVMRRLFAD